MLDDLISGGTVTTIALAILAVELAVLIGLAALRRLREPFSPIANALSGVFLILALRGALLDHGSETVALFLGLAGAAHLSELAVRLRR